MAIKPAAFLHQLVCNYNIYPKFVKVCFCNPNICEEGHRFDSILKRYVCH